MKRIKQIQEILSHIESETPMQKKKDSINYNDIDVQIYKKTWN